MAFNINAHVILSGPKGIRAVRKKIQSQLGSIRIPIKLDTTKGLTRDINQINKSIRTLRADVNKLSASATKANTSLGALSNKFRTLNASSAAMSKAQASSAKQLGNTASQVGKAGNAISKFGKDAALALRRFAAFTVATTAVFGFVRAIGTAVKSGLQYQQTITKIIQVTGAASNQIESLNRTIDNLSNSLGVNANDLADIARTFAQTGQTIAEVEASMKAVARASLAPTFGSMKDTAEGLIAATAQFNIAAKDQEKVLGALNAVSKKFAVESEDLISVIRRAGGVFAASGRGFETPIEGLNQLIGVFTAVRSTTRESADTIAVGLRTIFTRIQRRGTIDFLKQFNIELVNAEGNFIGLFPAFQALSKGLAGIVQSGDALTLSAITEELGGVRQVGKLIPAITQFNKALRATEVAAKGAADGLDQDVRLALQPLAKQFELVQRRFETLIRTITETPTFDIMARSALALANALLSISESLAPLIPLLTALAAIKIGKGVMAFAGGFTGKVASAGGARAVGGNLGSFISGGGRGFASGGLAKGTDTVPAMLTPGEFVIKRSSAKKIGYGNLNRMNRYAQGGVVKPQYLIGGGTAGHPMSMPDFGAGSGAVKGFPMQLPKFTGFTASMNKAGQSLKNLSARVAHFTPTLTKASKALVGFRGIVVGAIAEATLGGLANMAIGGMGFGAKQTIAGTDISGRAGVSTSVRKDGKTINAFMGDSGVSEAGVVAAFDSVGPAVGSALAAAAMTAMIPGLAPFAPAVAVAVGALELFKGTMVGFAKQVEFNAFDKMRKSMDTSVEMLNRFNSLANITPTALVNLTHQVEATSDRFNDVKQAAIDRAKAENNFTAAGFFGREGVLSSFVGGGAGGTAVGAGTAALAGAGGGAAIGAALGAIVPVAIPVTAAIGAVVGGIGGLVGALMTTDQNVKTTAQGFDRAAQSITPKFIEGLNKAIDKTTNDLFSGMDEGVLKQISKTQTVDPNLDLANQAELTNRAFGKMNGALSSTDKSTQDTIARLQELNAISIKTGLVKAVEEEAKLLGDAAPEFKAAFSGMQQNVNGAIDGFFKGEKSLNDVMTLIDSDSKMTEASKTALKKYIMGKVEEINTNNKNAATLSLINKAAARTRSSIDALAAGLESFSSTTSDIANRSTILAGQIKNEFGQIFGEKSIGQLTNINPFDNIENATDREIDQGMAQFGPGASDLGGFVKSTRNLDEMFKGVVDELQNRGGDIKNVDVQNAIRSRLAATGAPPKVVEDILNQLGENIGARQGEGKTLTIEVLKDLLQGEGGVQSQFAESVQNITNEFKEATDDLNKFRNSILEAAQLSTELAKKRLNTELAIAEKQKNIQERVDKALGKAPKSLARVTGDLSKKVRTLAGGGTGIPVGGNVLDPRTLFNRLGGLEDRRKQLRDRLGLKPGEELKASATRTPEFMQAAQELAQLNAQINGTEKALEELANDTTRLAKLESLMADAKAKELASTGSIVSLLDAISAVRTGKMDRKTFQQQVAAPLQAVEDVFAGQAIGFDAAVDLIGRIRSGDQLIGGQLQRKASEQAMLTGRQGEEAQIIQEILQSLLRSAGQTVMQNDTSGFGEFIGRQLQFSGQQRGRARRAGAAMIGVGDRQSQILAETMARRDAQFREEVLRPAQEGFMNAAMRFDQAVQKFVRMRGGRGLASGGVVTMAAGGNVFKPKGTDTVPAMLTPGEYVINRSSAQKIGYGNLHQLNKFNKGGKVQYLGMGGPAFGGPMGGAPFTGRAPAGKGPPDWLVEGTEAAINQIENATQAVGGAGTGAVGSVTLGGLVGMAVGEFLTDNLGITDKAAGNFAWDVTKGVARGTAAGFKEAGLATADFVTGNIAGANKDVRRDISSQLLRQGNSDTALFRVVTDVARTIGDELITVASPSGKAKMVGEGIEGFGKSFARASARSRAFGGRTGAMRAITRDDAAAAWKILGIDATKKADPETVIKAYRRLSKIYHPDKATGSAEKMKELTQAYAIFERIAGGEKVVGAKKIARGGVKPKASASTQPHSGPTGGPTGYSQEEALRKRAAKAAAAKAKDPATEAWTSFYAADYRYRHNQRIFAKGYQNNPNLSFEDNIIAGMRFDEQLARFKKMSPPIPPVNRFQRPRTMNQDANFQRLRKAYYNATDLDRHLGWSPFAKGGKVPRYQTGTDLVSRSGLAYLHKGEQVRPARSANGLSRTTTTQGDGNIFNEMQKGSALLTTELTSAFSVGASKMEPLVQALNSIPHEITLRAQLGAVTVNLAGGQILESLKNGIVAQMRKEIAEAIRSAINPVTGETVAPSISPFMGGPGEGRAGATEAIS